MFNALVVPVEGLNAARLNVPETALLAPVSSKEQSARAVVAAAMRVLRKVKVRIL